MAEEPPKMYGATSAGEQEASAGALPHAQSEVPTARRSWGTSAAYGLVCLCLAGVAYSVRGGGGSDAANLRTYLDDDLFAGHVKTWSDEETIIRKMDNGSHLSCDDWDDDSIYPTGKCYSGDKTQCEYLTNYSAFETLCYDSCNVTNATWGVPCAWEAISNLDKACETVSTGHKYFNWSLPDDSGDMSPDLYKEYRINEEEGLDYVPYAFNSSIDSSEWDDCNTHAYCYSCVDDDGNVDAFCKYMLSKYTTVYGAQAFFKNFDFWCSKVQLIESADGSTTGDYAVDTSCADDPTSDGCEGYQELLDFKDSYAKSF